MTTTSKPGPALDPDQVTELHRGVLDWFAAVGRDLPWRRPDASAWGVFLSEVMSQQTPLARVEPIWWEWMRRWPTPADLAAAPAGDAVREWGRLGYPRRALRLHEAARVMVERHGGAVPDTYEALLELPGVGPYTASAVAVFAHGLRATVVDTNVRRVEARAVTGVALPAPALTRAETELATALLPSDDEQARVWNVAVMELGALVCVARGPRCGECPVRQVCAWQLAGAPAHDGPPRRGQAWHGTDRQVRGALLAVLRAASTPVSGADLAAAWPDDELKRMRCLDSLVADGLVEPLADDRYALPGHA